MKKQEIFNSIDEELTKAISKHPNFPKNIFEQIAIMQEESGEAVRACLHYKHEDGNVQDIAEELIQTAAMCVRMLLNSPLDKIIKSYKCPDSNCEGRVVRTGGEYECLTCDTYFSKEQIIFP